MRKVLLLTSSICCLLLLLTSCSLLRGEIKFDYDKFKSEKAAWENAGISDYSYDYYHWGLFKVKENVQVQVSGNLVVSFVPINNSQVDTFNKTISDIYGEIENRYLSVKGKIYPDSEVYLTGISVTYSSYHVPVSFTYEYYVPPGTLDTDSSYVFEVRNFTTL